jgi:DNA invertase Pin-like site-specific DNA recombinase
VASNKLRAVLYLRLSVSDDASTSIMRQEDDLRELAEREGWNVVRILIDDGLSGRKARANAAEALRLLREQEAEVLAVWKLDRWTRQGLGAIGDLVAALDAAPGALFVAMKDSLRSDQASWRLIAAVLSEVARTEADNTAMRVSASFAAGKASGRFTGGTIPFGYRPVKNTDAPGRMLVPVPEEVVELRRAADRLLRGEKVYPVVRDLNARRVPTARSAYRRRLLLSGERVESLERGTWTSTILQSILTSDNLVGRVTHRGKAILGEDGLPVQFWEPLLDHATLVRLRARIRNPKDLTQPTRPQRRRQARLLSGVAYCAHCDSKMYVNTSGAKPVYACPMFGKGCAHGPRMTAELAERFVAERFLAIVGAQPEVELLEQVDDPATHDALAQVEEALRQSGAELLSDDGDPTDILAHIGALKARRATLRATPATVTIAAVPTGRTLAEAWEAEESLDRRRELLLTAADHVTIAKLADGAARKGLHPERVEVRWVS